jgi:putative endonuclease
LTERLEKSPEFIEGQIAMYFVYILRDSNGHLYIGCSINPRTRLKRHNSGNGSEFTRRNKNFMLVYAERFETLIDARRRERQIKGWRREKKDNLIKFGKPLTK